MISGAVAGVDRRDAGGADPFGEGKDCLAALDIIIKDSLHCLSVY